MSSSTCMQQGGKLTPNLDERSTKLLNLTVLQRIDPCIEEILITAAHVAFYEFNVDLNKWSRKEVEGSLFVVKRNAQPRFQFIVMNRRNTENLVEDLLGDFEFEIQLPYLLYRNGAQEVNGIWFYNAHECEEVADLFGRILGAYSKVPSKPQLTRREFEEHGTVPTSTVIAGPLEPSVTNSTTTNGAEESSFMNFFNIATSIGHTSSNAVSSGQPYYSPSQTVNPSPRVPSTLPSPALNLQVSLSAQAAPSIPTQSCHDSTDLINTTNNTAKLVKPSFFTPPASPALPRTSVSSAILTTALYTPVNLHLPHGTALVQPFPPPNPPPSLTCTQFPTNSGPLSREKVSDALLVLVQDNQFIDLVYEALLKAHQS